jgi:predicted nucleic acid-binding protein
MAAISALLDSCVLYPARLRDLLLSLAAAGFFRPFWSEMIHEEWIRNVLANRPDLTRAQLDAARSAMDRAFPAASISGFERLVPTLKLPDPDDRHILAAAIHARAELIVTVNLKDFPAAALTTHSYRCSASRCFRRRSIRSG